MSKMVLPDGGPVKMVKGKATPNPYQPKAQKERQGTTITVSGKSPEKLEADIKEKLPENSEVLHATHTVILNKETKKYERGVSLTYQKKVKEEGEESGD